VMVWTGTDIAIFDPLEKRRPAWAPALAARSDRYRAAGLSAANKMSEVGRYRPDLKLSGNPRGPSSTCRSSVNPRPAKRLVTPIIHQVGVANEGKQRPVWSFQPKRPMRFFPGSPPARAAMASREFLAVGWVATPLLRGYGHQRVCRRSLRRSVAQRCERARNARIFSRFPAHVPCASGNKPRDHCRGETVSRLLAPYREEWWIDKMSLAYRRGPTRSSVNCWLAPPRPGFWMTAAAKPAVRIPAKPAIDVVSQFEKSAVESELSPGRFPRSRC